MRCGEELELFTSSVSMARKRVPYHTRLKSNFDRLLYIIFFYSTVRFVSVNGEASTVKPLKTILTKKF